MVKDMSPREEQRGTGALFTWISVAVVAVGIGLAIWFFVPGFGTSKVSNEAANGPRSNQTQGMSVTAQATKPISGTTPTPQATDGSTVGRNERLTGSATADLNLSPDQVTAIKSYAAEHGDQRVKNVNFTMTVGAAVPQQTQLRDIPPSLGRSLRSMSGDQYIIVGTQFIVVEKSTRRIVAIVPLQA